MILMFRSGLDSIEQVHRVWRQLCSCLNESFEERIVIKSSFIKVLFIDVVFIRSNFPWFRV